VITTPDSVIRIHA